MGERVRERERERARKEKSSVTTIKTTEVGFEVRGGKVFFFSFLFTYGKDHLSWSYPS